MPPSPWVRVRVRVRVRVKVRVRVRIRVRVNLRDARFTGAAEKCHTGTLRQ